MLSFPRRLSWDATEAVDEALAKERRDLRHKQWSLRAAILLAAGAALCVAVTAGDAAADQVATG